MVSAKPIKEKHSFWGVFLKKIQHKSDVQIKASGLVVKVGAVGSHCLDVNVPLPPSSHVALGTSLASCLFSGKAMLSYSAVVPIRQEKWNPCKKLSVQVQPHSKLSANVNYGCCYGAAE